MFHRDTSGQPEVLDHCFSEHYLPKTPYTDIGLCSTIALS
jgi:hypothetical protein